VRKNPSAIAAALARGDFDTIRSIGHNMKGTGGSFGLPQISRLGADLEQAANRCGPHYYGSIGHFLESVEIRYR
jgi:HPt (histidine-containing phosphotransfer) domain-containing protein